MLNELPRMDLLGYGSSLKVVLLTIFRENFLWVSDRLPMSCSLTSPDLTCPALPCVLPFPSLAFSKPRLERHIVWAPLHAVDDVSRRLGAKSCQGNFLCPEDMHIWMTWRFWSGAGGVRVGY
jgi:hypothetical protein